MMKTRLHGGGIYRALSLSEIGRLSSANVMVCFGFVFGTEVDDSDKERAHVETQAKSSRLVPMHDKVVKSNGYLLLFKLPLCFKCASASCSGACGLKRCGARCGETSLGNLGFINIIVIVFRVRWFEKRFKEVGERPSSPSS
jgi:hypothetical protein